MRMEAVVLDLMDLEAELGQKYSFLLQGASPQIGVFKTVLAQNLSVLHVMQSRQHFV